MWAVSVGAGWERFRALQLLGFAVLLAGSALYNELIRMHREEGLDFSGVTTFNLDEYVGLDGTHDQSYRYFMTENLFRHINVPLERPHVPSGMAEDYAVHGKEYEQAIEERAKGRYEKESPIHGKKRWAALTPEEWRGYLKGQVFKYLWRSNLKGRRDEDFNKAQWYLSRLTGGE